MFRLLIILFFYLALLLGEAVLLAWYLWQRQEDQHWR